MLASIILALVSLNTPGPMQQKAEVIGHVKFVDAGIKFDHIWISLLNYRAEAFMNTEVSYSLYLLNNPHPIIQNRQLPPTAFQRFPVVDVRIELKELGIALTQDTSVTFILLVTDGNTGRDRDFLKRVLSFQISGDGKLGVLNQNASFPITSIPILYTFEERGQTVLLFPQIRENQFGSFRIADFQDVTVTEDSTVSAVQKAIQGRDLDLKKRDQILKEVTSLTAKKKSEASFRSRIRRITQQR